MRHIIRGKAKRLSSHTSTMARWWNKHMVCLLVSWAFLVLICVCMLQAPPGTAPDEIQHYVKAAGVSQGQIILPNDPVTPVGPTSKPIAWLLSQSKMVVLPSRLDPAPVDCLARSFTTNPCRTLPSPASKAFPTYVGRYPPTAYLVPGLLIGLADNPVQGLYLGRAATALMSAALLAAATFAVWDARSSWSLAGLVATVTPMVVYVSAMLSSSGLETAASICTVSCALRLTRRQLPPRWTWGAFGISAGLLATGRDLGPAWLGACLLTVFLLRGRTAVGASLRQGGKKAVYAGAAIAAATAMALIWQATQQQRLAVSLSTLVAQLRPSLGELQATFLQLIGNFGILDTPLALWAYLLWSVLIVFLIVTALVLGSRRERVALLLGLSITTASAAVLSAYQKAIGFGPQGRHLLPLAIVVPLAAGEIVWSNRGAIKASALAKAPALIGAASALVMPAAWLTLSRRYSTTAKAEPWFAPLGFRILAMLSLLAALMLVVALYRGPSVEPEPPASLTA